MKDISLMASLPEGKSTHWDIRGRSVLLLTSLHCSCVWNLNDESLGWIASYPNPLRDNVLCGERINLFSVFMLFGSCDDLETELYRSPSFETKSHLEKYQKNKKEGLRKFMSLFFLNSAVFPLSEAQTSISVQLPAALTITQWYLLTGEVRAGNITVWKFGY